MRTISSDVAVRLYYLDDGEGGAASTLLYGTLAEALRLAGEQAEDIQAGLFLQTSDDVVAYLDLVEEYWRRQAWNPIRGASCWTWWKASGTCGSIVPIR
jgi:hypothetical protein